MNLRPELVPDKETAYKNSEAINMLFSNIEIELNLGNDDTASSWLFKLNTLVNKNYNLNFFREYWGWISKKDLILIIGIPSPGIHPIKRDELEEIIERIKAMDEDENFYLDLLNRNFSHPEIINLIYQELSSSEITSIIINHRPIQL